MEQKNKMKLIFIMGLSHSGSTLLDMMLSFYPGAIGLGELHAVADGKTTNTERTFDICSCGKSMKECEFWGQMKSFFIDNDQKDKYKAYYTQFVQMVKDAGKNIIIDSSKSASTLKHVRRLEKEGFFDVSVIYIEKDIRSYLQSMHNYYNRQNRRWRPYWYTMGRWMKRRQVFEKYIKDEQVPHLRVSYEKLCFETSATMKSILDYAGLDYDQFSFNNEMCSHVAFGNRTKKKFRGVEDIQYSSGWMYNYWLQWAVLLAHPVLLLQNKKENEK